MNMSQILKFWIIHHPSGICIFEQTFESLPGDVDDQIVTGYLYAITNLSQEIAHQPIDFIQLANIRFLYQQAHHFIMVMVTDNHYFPEQGKSLLSKLQDQFQEIYGQFFENGFNFDVSPFGSFAENVELTINSKAKHFQFLDTHSCQFKDVIEHSKAKWKDIHTSITTQAKNAGKWICGKTSSLNAKIEDNIKSGRQHQLEIEEKIEKKEKINQNRHWV